MKIFDDRKSQVEAKAKTVSEINEERIKADKADPTQDPVLRAKEDAPQFHDTDTLNNNFFAELRNAIDAEMSLLGVSFPTDQRAIENLAIEGAHSIEKPFESVRPEFKDPVLIDGSSSFSTQEFIQQIEARAPFTKKIGSISGHAKRLSHLVWYQRELHKDNTSQDTQTVQAESVRNDMAYRRRVREAALKELGYMNDFERDVHEEKQRLKKEKLSQQFADMQRKKDLSDENIRQLMRDSAERSRVKREARMQAQQEYKRLMEEARLNGQVLIQSEANFISEYETNASRDYWAKKADQEQKLRDTVAS